ncbi:hypothetical protein K3718_08855 [Leisingera aquaemixtae]|uniref:Class I SAM-dependent methyltransferase n=1 Tax=Leisingera aquaemixtae TaxID=1396826 RepID=A0ABY5WP74_9RHOB|nr:hypothetical protein K3718_08855 [Leisingera aquaemixtae]
MDVAKDEQLIERPALTLPPEEAEWVCSHYQEANVILEYGSGGSTVLASELSGKKVFSVESDKMWYRMMKRYLRQAGSKSEVHLHHASVGKTGKWGRPLNNDMWRRFHQYPNSVWDLDTFEAPDLVLIDGRFRAACFLTAMLRTERPVTLLFDDYAGRALYKQVERWVKPVEIRGRMARFELLPDELPRRDLTQILTLYTKTF